MAIQDLTSKEFVNQLASSAPTPGGGGAAAIAGAIGTALGNMVGSLTMGKQKYAAVQDQIQDLNNRAKALELELLELAQKDATAFEPLAKAYGLPQDTAFEQTKKQRILEDCLRNCCEVPLSIMRACAQAIDLHAEYAVKGAAIALSDVGCGVAICKAALQSASLNVFINTKAMHDRSYAEKISHQAQQLLDQYIAQAEAIYTDVENRLK